MTARQTIINTRGQTALASEVASVVSAEEIGRARKSLKRTTTDRRGVRTTFCPLCGGTKTLTAFRCATCQHDAQSRGAKAARANGKWTHGRSAAARSLIGEAITRENPSHGDETPQQGVTWSRRARGEGHVRQQAWDRKVLVDGQWIAESQTPEGLERKRLDDEAARRLEAVPA